MLYFVPLPEGATTQGAFHHKERWAVAYNSEGENHAGHCPGSRQRVPEQQSLLGAATGAESNGFDPA